MKICFQAFSIPEEMRLKICINEMEKELNPATPKVVFDLDEGTYHVALRLMKHDPIPACAEWILYFLTILLQGIFHILLLNTESNWIRNAHPFDLCADFTVCVAKDMNLKLFYKDASFIDETMRWKLPFIQTDPIYPIKVIYCPRIDEMKQAYLKYARKLGSILAVTLTVLSYLLYVAATREMIFVVWILTAIICGIGCVALFLFHSQNQKRKNIARAFENQFADMIRSK